MRPSKTIIFVALFFAIVTATLLFNSVVTVRSSGVQLTHKEFTSLLKRAMAGDAKASDGLADYYMYGNRNYGLALLFRERAAILGDKHSQELLRDFLNRYGVSEFRSLTGRTNEFMERDVARLLLEAKPENE